MRAHHSEFQSYLRTFLLGLASSLVARSACPHRQAHLHHHNAYVSCL